MVIAIIAILAGMLLPALAKAKQKTQGIKCMNNGKQMMLAWRLYADDNEELLVKSLDGGPEAAKRALFVAGNASDPPTNTVDKSPLMKYMGNSREVWRCPSDPTTRKEGKLTLPRVRSISMSQVFDFGGWLPAPPYSTYGRLGHIVNPTQTWVVVDEHPLSINDAACAVPDCEAGRKKWERALIFPPHITMARADFPSPMAIRRFINGKGAKLKPLAKGAIPD